LAPAATPTPIVNKIATDVREIVTSAEFATYLDTIQSEPFASTPSEFAEFIKQELKKNRDTVVQAGISAEP
jgi:tripartite-type tricarboxylate transporter receptor subunit TctC